MATRSPAVPSSRRCEARAHRGPLARRRDHQLDVAGEQREPAPVVEDEARRADRAHRVPVAAVEGRVVGRVPAVHRGAHRVRPRDRARADRATHSRRSPRSARAHGRGDAGRRSRRCNTLPALSNAPAITNGLSKAPPSRVPIQMPSQSVARLPVRRCSQRMSDVGRELDHCPERLHERDGTAQRAPARQPVILADEAGRVAGGDGIPVAARECRVEVAQERHQCGVLRAFADLPARVEFGPGGVEIASRRSGRTPR